ncbi:MAG TPA: hypothetical protein ENJ82_15345 [Bacteroidetes bacterium]|nr:hypothetical protein [Bacteroidota bacterium]
MIKNAISEEVCDAILAKMKATPKEDGSTMPIGWAYPVIFPELVIDAYKNGEAEAEAKMQKHFEKFEIINQNSEKYFGAPVIEFVEEWLGKFSGGREVIRPHGYGGKGEYATATFRSYYGNGKGNISVHCGNLFQTVWKKFYGHLEQQVDIYDQLSYFFLLQEPVSGGELTLYDFEWEDGQKKKSNHENKEVFMADGKSIALADRETMMIRPRKGDMILFAGGQIWHRIEAVMGNQERVTLAGFLSYSQGKEKIVYWT